MTRLHTSRLVTAAILVLTGVSLVAGLFAVYRRFHCELRNRRVEIGVDWADVTQLAQMCGRPLPVVLRRFKTEHVTTLIISEDTVVGLVQSGAIKASRTPIGAGGRVSVLSCDDAATEQRIVGALRLRAIRVLPLTAASAPGQGSTVIQSTGDPKSWWTPVSYSNLRSLGIGLPPSAVSMAHRIHLLILGRVANFAGASSQTAANVLNALHAQGAHAVIFQGDEVLGYSGAEQDVADELSSSSLSTSEDASQSSANVPSPTGLTYGAVEFGKQRGDARLTSLLRGDYIRVHTVQPTEMAQMTEHAIIDRYALAVRERNIRFLFVHPFTYAGADPVGLNVSFFEKLWKDIASRPAWTGGALLFGEAHPFDRPAVPRWAFGLIGLGAAAGIVVCLFLIGPFPSGMAPPLLGALSVAFGAVAMSGSVGQKLVALVAGIVWPLAACLLVWPGPVKQTETPGRCALKGITRLLLASCVTAVGIVQVAGLLAARSFMLKADQFLGIKAQHALPVLAVAALALVGGVSTPSERWTEFRARVQSRLKAAMQEPARYGALLLILVALIALLIVVARTGNDSGVGASSVELRFRDLLDRLMPVRPRTKEFLVGHPAFVLALAWWFRGRRKPAICAFVVGSLGQVSILNTFCHIHTPLIISVWRVCSGLVVGGAIGLIAFFVFEKYLPNPAGSPAAGEPSSQ
ncbi:MAG: hypothetical protein KGJ62_09945 [Armatimonadetes bacterium]|nr:hypothetical protein [Armatimonadota bacterium]MDE2207512.1 hypothetical protein [Armatimonadota bacterium]